MICDGMTQNTTALPHFKTKPSWKGRDELGVHVEGIMVQNRAPHLEFALPNVRLDGNQLIDTVHRTILREQDARAAEGTCLPDVFYLQLDNVNTNKSKDLMAYCSFLVEKGVFKKIKINFLMVGHTHENIDQLFSRFSVSLRSEDALTVKMLMKVARESFTPSPTCEEIFGQLDWNSWIKPHRALFQDISFNLAFRIKRVDGLVVLHTKQYGHQGYKVWRSEAVRCLKSIPADKPNAFKLGRLKPQDMTALYDLHRNIQDHMMLAYTGEIKEFWDHQVQFQQRVNQNLETVDIDCTFPAAATYQAPPGKYLFLH